MLLGISIFLIIVIAYGIFALLLYFMQSKFLYLPKREIYYTPAELELPFEDISIQTPDNETITGWYIPAENAEITVLFCHGQGGNIMHRLDTINIFNELGLNCLMFDYRGYGHSTGKPTEQGTYIDTQTAYDWLVNTKKQDPENIIIFGRSMGCAIAANLASRVKAKAVVLESGFTSFGDIGQKFYPYMPVKLFATFSYNTIEYIKKTDIPVLIIHSKDDEIVPFEFGQKLYNAASEPKEFLEIFGRHNDGFLMTGDRYRNGLENWIESMEYHEKPENIKLKKHFS